jgi:hypothetical protein
MEIGKKDAVKLVGAVDAVGERHGARPFNSSIVPSTTHFRPRQYPYQIVTLKVSQPSK